MGKIKNIKHLRDDLLEMYEDIKVDKVSLREAKERSNTAGKIMKTVKLELEYKTYIKDNSKIPFLDTSNDNE